MTSTEENAQDPQDFKDKGNNCVKNGQYAEAILHYTHAIKLDPKNYSLFSNRSFAFLKLNQLYLALEDADQTIVLKNDWAKGYFRKAEIYLAAFQYSDALIYYRKALQLQPNDDYIVQSIKKTHQLLVKENRAEQQTPWLGAGIGLIVGVMIVLADVLLIQKPTLSNPILMVLLTVAVAMIGFGIAKVVRYLKKSQRDGLLEAPLDLLKDQMNDGGVDKESETKSERNARCTKSQARQRFKKGRL